MRVQRRVSPDNVHYRLESNVKARFIAVFNASALEESTFQGGRMIFSSIYRKVNGHEKVNRKSVLQNNLYTVTDFSSTQTRNPPIVNLNTHGLFFQEPITYWTVYSENFQRLIQVNSKGDHVYELNLPDGSQNIYHYKGGICVQVEVHSTLFNANILLDDTSTKRSQ